MVASEKRLLEANGHSVVQLLWHNREIDAYSVFKKPGLFLNTLWSGKSYHRIRRALEKEQPDVAHFHNTLPLVSAAGYYACQRLNVPVVQTLHNFRLICPAGTLLRDGILCNDCVSHSLARAVRHGCYRNSRLETSAVSAMLAVHRYLGTWEKQVDAYIALTKFMGDTLVRSGFPRHKIFVKPNFTSHDLSGASKRCDYVLFWGRLSKEKGLMTLVESWKQLPGVPLKIVGQGPMADSLARFIRNNALSRVELTGFRSGPDLFKLIQSAGVVIHPAEWYEGFPVTLAESFSAGKPVIASRLGAMTEIIQHGKNGLLFTPGDPDDLAAKVRWALNHSEEMQKMGDACRRQYLKKYRPETNYKELLSIYHRVKYHSRPK